MVIVFFFQAEDGIRDVAVTGVQTCALPIFAREIVAVGRRVGSLEPALADGAVDRITTDIAEGVAGADLVVLATPVATLEAQLPAVWRAAATALPSRAWAAPRPAS